MMIRRSKRIAGSGLVENYSDPLCDMFCVVSMERNVYVLPTSVRVPIGCYFSWLCDSLKNHGENHCCNVVGLCFAGGAQ